MLKVLKKTFPKSIALTVIKIAVFEEATFTKSNFLAFPKYDFLNFMKTDFLDLAKVIIVDRFSIVYQYLYYQFY